MSPSSPDVLVTGAGGAAGVAVIRALQSAGHRVVAVDPDERAFGLALADDAAIVPFATADHFAAALAGIAKRTECAVIISTVAEEMLPLGSTEGASLVRESGAVLWIPAPESVRACIDKLHFAEALVANRVPGPVTVLGGDARPPGPWIVKPRFGRGSRDVYAVDEGSELEWALRRVEEPIVQTRVEGREFTVDALVDLDGSLCGAVPRWRIQTRAGISTQGSTFHDPTVVEAARGALAAVRLCGVANVQGFVRADGSVSVVEVNPRFSGGLPLSLAAGADLVGEYVRAALGFTIRPERLRFRAGVSMRRAYVEVFDG